jgi:hypothetical protein
MKKRKTKKAPTKSKNLQSNKMDFSSELDSWLKGGRDQTILGLDQIFGDRTFAIIFMFLMATSALPIPTAGVTDVFAVITIIFALQMTLGRNSLWLPKRWRNMKINKTMRTKLLPGLVKVARRIEKHSETRMLWVFKGRVSDAILGLSVATLAFFTITAPPFSGLDTIPALGVVLISAGIILKDGLITLIGGVVGGIGIGVQVLLGKLVVDLIKGLFN